MYIFHIYMYIQVGWAEVQLPAQGAGGPTPRRAHDAAARHCQRAAAAGPRLPRPLPLRPLLCGDCDMCMHTYIGILLHRYIRRYMDT